MDAKITVVPTSGEYWLLAYDQYIFRFGKKHFFLEFWMHQIDMKIDFCIVWICPNMSKWCATVSVKGQFFLVLSESSKCLCLHFHHQVDTNISMMQTRLLVHYRRIYQLYIYVANYRLCLWSE